MISRGAKAERSAPNIASSFTALELRYMYFSLAGRKKVSRSGYSRLLIRAIWHSFS